RPRTRPVGQDGWANDGPVKTAPAYDPLLCILVGVNTPKDQPQGGIIEESSVATTVACSKAGDANQSLNRLRLHRINEDASGLRKQARPAEDQFRIGRCSKRLNDRIHACWRTFNRVLVKRITFQLLEFGIVQTNSAY